jgi:putative radical SAM enzyme (TIGR03279 family)
MPAGLRPSLYVKDDDYRLSFLNGNFITLSNLTDDDLRRIERLRLSPLYVSLHAWNDDVRTALMGRAVRPTRERLLRLAQAGVESHIQVVLCPGYNDDTVLRDTIGRLSGVPGVADVGVVPVSLMAEGRLRRVTGADAAAAVELVESLQPALEDRLGRRFAHAADELYLLAGRIPPPADAPEQYENGIGLCAAFLDEARSLAGMFGDARPAVALLTGTLAQPVVAAAAELLGAARPYIVENRLFGGHVTVTGLLGGRDVLRALADRPLADDEWLLAPRSFLPAGLGRTLDDVDEADVRAACGGRLVIADDLGGAFATLPGP